MTTMLILTEVIKEVKVLLWDVDLPTDQSEIPNQKSFTKPQ